MIGGALETGEESGNVFALAPNSNYWEWVGALALPRSGHIAAPVPGAGQIVIQGKKRCSKISTNRALGGRGLRADEIWFRNDTTFVSDTFSHNRTGASLLVLPGEFVEN